MRSVSYYYLNNRLTLKEVKILNKKKQHRDENKVIKMSWEAINDWQNLLLKKTNKQAVLGTLQHPYEIWDIQASPIKYITVHYSLSASITT